MIRSARYDAEIGEAEIGDPGEHEVASGVI
jgi:hypothetical protein